jgi:hypothetical protein
MILSWLKSTIVHWWLLLAWLWKISYCRLHLRSRGSVGSRGSASVALDGLTWLLPIPGVTLKHVARLPVTPRVQQAREVLPQSRQMEFEENRWATWHQVVGTHRKLKFGRINSVVHNIGHRGTQRGIESFHVNVHDMCQLFRKIFKVMTFQNGWTVTKFTKISSMKTCHC